MKKTIEPRIRLIERRVELNKTHQQIADDALITRAYYTNIERGVKDPSLDVAERIVKSLKSTVDALFFRIESSDKEQ